MKKTILESSFTNELKAIRTAIDNITDIDCINQYASYLSKEIDMEESPLEYDFKKILIRNNEQFIRKIISNSIKKKYDNNFDKLLIRFVDDQIDTPYSYINAFDNGDLSCFIKEYTKDDIFYPLMKEQMDYAFGIMVSNYQKSDTEKSIEHISNEIQNQEKNLELIKTKIDSYKKDLKKLKGEN